MRQVKERFIYYERNIIQTSARPLQLKRAFQNIIDNSIRYANKLNIEISANDEGCRILFEDNEKRLKHELLCGNNINTLS